MPVRWLLMPWLFLAVAAQAQPSPTPAFRIPRDPTAPRPPVIDPGTAGLPDRPARPPSDATVLFDGKDLSRWMLRPRGRNAKPEPAAPIPWKVENGSLVVAPRTGSLITRDSFGDCQIHVEWATPDPPSGSGQMRGNSGVILPGHAEIQILDSHGNDAYPDGQAGAVYGKAAPMVNASRPPGQWQSFDIVFRSPRLDPDGGVTEPAIVTALHNGILVQDRVPTGGRAPTSPILLQDHLNPVHFRNIWVRPLHPNPPATPAGS